MSPVFPLGWPSAGFMPGDSGSSWDPRGLSSEPIRLPAPLWLLEILSGSLSEGPEMGSPSLPLRVVADRLQEEGLLLGAIGLEEPTITGVTQDSREVNPGDLFLCWKGVDHDAHAYLRQAAEAGAVARL